VVGKASFSTLLINGGVRAEVWHLAFLAMGVWKSPANLDGGYIISSEGPVERTRGGFPAASLDNTAEIG